MRLNTLTKQFKPNEAVLLTSSQSLKYYANYVGSNGKVIAFGETVLFFTDFRYVEQVKQECIPCTLHQVTTRKEMLDIINDVCEQHNINTLLLEENNITMSFLNEIKDVCEKLKLEPAEQHINAPRIIKTEEEVQAITKAAKIADKAFAHLLQFIKKGMTEMEVALELEFYLRKQGAAALSFESIVAAGPNGALPHAKPSNHPLQEGDLLVLDFGCVVDGYCSDMTRTVAIGEIDEKLQTIYDITYRAQQHAMENIQAGMTGKEADALARNIIKDAGYGDYFGHGLGHGVGVEIHEAPRLSFSSTDTLEEGMIVTVEPGIYLPNKGGVRIEDLCVVTKTGLNALSTSPKELIML